jgi:hypothetical protein
MKRKIRTSVFETNSSSSHSLCIQNGSLDDSRLSKVDGIIYVEGGEYGWEIESYWSQSEKLQYLFTMIMSNHYEEAPENVSQYTWLQEVIKEYTGAELQHTAPRDDFYPFGYVDHQSSDTLDEFLVSDKTECKEGMKEFIFNSRYYFKTDNDNH